MLVLGIDSGTKHIGWASVEVTGAGHRSTLILCGELENVPDWNVMMAKVHGLVRSCGPDLVGIERVSGKAHDEGDLKKAAAKSRSLIGTAEVVGLCAGIVLSMGIPIDLFPAVDWRHGIVGNRYASDASISSAIRTRILGVPRCSNHMRDAMGVAVYASTRLRLSALGFEKNVLRDR